MSDVEALRRALVPFCTRRPIKRLAVFGSVARGEATPDSDVDLLVTLTTERPIPSAELFDMAGEAEELVGAPVDFVLIDRLESTPSAKREEILASAICLYAA